MARPERRFYVELADRYHLPVGELLRRFTAPEITELMALYDLRANPPKKVQTPAETRAALSALAKGTAKRSKKGPR